MTNQIEFTWPTPGNTIISTKRGMEYIIGQPINSGGYALVFEGVDLFGNAIALKVYKPARPFEELRKQWENECRIFEKVRHPNVVAIYDSFICDNLFYIVLERAWGNLCDWIQIIGTSEVTTREITRQLLFATYFIHTHGILHRDISIYNTLVFIGPQNAAIHKISDFGISKEFLDPWGSKIASTQIAHPCLIPPELLLPQYYIVSDLVKEKMNFEMLMLASPPSVC